MSLPKFDPQPIDENLLDKLRDTANRAADAAAEQTLQFFRQPIDVENKDRSGGFDPVTAADKGAEKVIKAVIAQDFPDHGFLGEESAPIVSKQQPVWVVDPIDGTRSFITGVPMWGTLIGVYDGAQTILGVMDQPYIGERLIGTPALTQLHDRHGVRSLSTRKTTALASAIVQTTGPDYFKAGFQQRVLNQIKAVTSMVRFGGDCYCYALLAMGYVDLVVECDLNAYDIQALIPIVRGAGGVITDWQGNATIIDGSVVASANAALHEQALALIAQQT